MAMLDGPLDVVIRKDLDGLLLTPGKPLRLRRNGSVAEVGTHRLSGGEILAVLSELVPEGGPPTEEVGSRWKFVYRRGGIDFEFSAGLTPEGWSVASSPRVRRFRRPDKTARVERQAALLTALGAKQSALSAILEGALDHAADEEGPGRRTNPRVALRTEVRFEVDSMVFSAQISDLSAGGAFVDTANPLDVGAELRYQFFLPGADCPVEGSARVAWRQPMVGMGIEFLSPPLTQATPSPEAVPRAAASTPIPVEGALNRPAAGSGRRSAARG